MAIAAKETRKAFSFTTRLSGPGAGEWRRAACFALLVVVGCAGIGRQAPAMFVTPSKENDVPQTSPTSPEEAEAPQPDGPRLPRDVRPGDAELRMQLQEIAPVPVEKRRVNSNSFSRMSGQTENLKPVTVPASSIKRAQAPPPEIDEPLDPPQRAFTIGSWAFILACLGAAALGLFKIKKLTSSG
jgi:hypothetical protein